MSGDKSPWYESGLFWGCASLAGAIVLTVIAAMLKDLRWLLVIAWPLAGVSVWVAFRELRNQVWRWFLFLALWAGTAIGLWCLNSVLKPSIKQPAEQAPPPTTTGSATPASDTHPSVAQQPAASPKRMPPSARPYVLAEAVQFVSNDEQVEIRYHNSGGTPAIDLGLSSRYAIADSSFDLDKIKPADLSVPSGYGDVSAGDWISNRIDSHKIDHPTEFAAMKEGKLHGYVFGYLKYTDLDGISYEPRFCFTWLPQDNAFGRCPANAFVRGQKLR